MCDYKENTVIYFYFQVMIRFLSLYHELSFVSQVVKFILLFYVQCQVLQSLTKEKDLPQKSGIDLQFTFIDFILKSHAQQVTFMQHIWAVNIHFQLFQLDQNYPRMGLSLILKTILLLICLIFQFLLPKKLSQALPV